MEKPSEDSVDNSENHNINENTVDNIDYYHIEKLYDDKLYEDMKSGKCYYSIQHQIFSWVSYLIYICFLSDSSGALVVAEAVVDIYN